MERSVITIRVTSQERQLFQALLRAGSRPRWLRIMFWPLSRSVCVV